MSKGGGGADTSGMEAAARESNELQKRMYEEAVERGTPFYEGGLGGFRTLLDYMGIAGGNAMQSREQIRDELSPSFTTMQTMGGGYNPDLMASDLTRSQQAGLAQALGQEQGLYNQDVLISDLLASEESRLNDPRHANLTAYNYLQNLQGRPVSEEVVDTAGLNAAIDARMAEQGENLPEHYGSLLDPFSADKFEVDPGYQFRMDEGQKALERRLSAQGKSLSPEAYKELMRFNQGLGSQEYANAYNRYNVDQGNVYNRLAGLAGMGQQQVQQLDTAGSNYAANVGQTNASLANAQAAAAQANQGSSMFDNLLGLGSLGIQAYGAGLFSDKRLKEDIKKVGEKNGFNLYEYRYKGQPTTFIGVMAQEVAKVIPEAVHKIGKYLAVDYDMIGIKLEVK